MLDEDSIGARVSAARKLRGLTQRRLADLAHVSYSLLTKVESGHVPATPAFIAAVARTLRVDVIELTGQPYRGSTARQDRVHATIPEIRRVLLAHDVVTDNDDPPRPVEELAEAVRRASALRQAARYAELGEMVPELISQLAYAARQASQGSPRERAYALLAEAYGAADAVAYKLGYTDLSTLAVERVCWAAVRSDDPLMIGSADWLRAGAFLAGGGYAEAEALLTSARSALEPLLARADPQTLSVYGSLHLKQAIVSARANEAQDAWAHIAEAEEVATRAGGDNNFYQLAFGPSNVSIHGVAVAVELGDGTEAVRRSQDFTPPSVMPAERSSHHYIDLARGYLWHGDRKGALDCLHLARKLAPQQTRYHPMVRETLQALARAERRSTHSLRGFAAWVGLSD
ncbi:MAG TPA: helix-turn-helix transcriptional regulator [Mycobacteriales bacterium]|nr:helix-turn-helix transcriptional regulator [Mycobacteriales bacterium]